MAGSTKKFYQMSIGERRGTLIGEGAHKDSLDAISRPSAPEELEGMIENIIGAGSLPIGVVRNFVMNGKKYAVPMMIEEPSVVAAASNASKMALPGGFRAESMGNEMIGQVELKVNDSKEAERLAKAAQGGIEHKGRELSSELEKYGGGWKGMSFRRMASDRGEALIAEFYLGVGNAMGANRVNMVAEGLAPHIANAVNGKAVMAVLSNLSVRRMVRSKATWKRETIGQEGIDGVLDAYDFALHDPFRLATNNKGLMNGIDAVALATGNDWRAIEAGLHYYSAMNNMRPLASYKETEDGIEGVFEGPLAVATIGGATGTLRHAKACLALLGVESAAELGQVMGCIGLANNFAALLALSTEGINRGHMGLHARNIAIQAGAKGDEISELAKRLSEEGKYDSGSAKALLGRIRTKNKKAS